MVEAKTEEQLWQLFFEDPSSWWDNRAVKSNLRFPDFKHAASGASLWINSRTCPRWVVPKLSSLSQNSSTTGSVELRQSSYVGSAAHKSREIDKHPLASYLKLLEDGVKPGTGMILAALKVCSNTRDLQAGKKIHRDVVDSGEVSNIFVANTLVDMYAKCGSMTEARQVFDSMRRRDVVSWTAIVQGYANSGEGELALKLYTRMQDEGYKSNRVSVLAALKACASLAEEEDGELVDGKHLKVNSLGNVRALHAQVTSNMAEMDLFVANSFIDVYSKCGSMVDARQVFETIRHRSSVVSWNCLIQGYAETGNAEEALVFFKLMQDQGFKADVVTFIAAFKACACLAEKEQYQVDGELIKTKSLKMIRDIHLQVADYSGDIVMANTLVDAYAKCGSLVDARRVFEGIGQHTVVSWTVIILGYAQNGKGDEALELYARMRDESCAANVVTILAALKACAGVAEDAFFQGKAARTECLRKGKTIHSEAARTGVDLSQCVSNSLVDMYAKCGSLDDALLVFQSMRRHDTVSWNCIILGYDKCGNSERALEMYSRMKDEDHLPDRITFLAAVKACASSAEVEDAKLVNGRAVKQQSLNRGREIHRECGGILGKLNLAMLNTLVDMYSKCGSMEDARQVFESMKERSVVSWNCIILGYAQHGEPELALEDYKRMRNTRAPVCRIL